MTDKKNLSQQNEEKKPYTYGQFESVKFQHRREDYYNGLEQILSMGYSPQDYMQYFPAFVGHMTLGRFLTLYELYKKTQNICGHIAEVGVDMGTSSLFFTKLIQLYEPEALTLVHGFDWFQGMAPTAEDMLVKAAQGESEARVRKLVTAQKLDHILKIHNLDVSKDIEDFFGQHPHMRFRMVYLDAGVYPVVSAAIKAFWPRLVPGGIMIFDQYNNELSPGEARAVSEYLPDMKIETLQNAWYPNAFVVKPYAR
jgi:hypothetical protein